MRTKLFLIVFAALIMQGCSKEDSKAENPPDTGGDYLSEEDNLFVESISVKIDELKNIIGADGNPLARTSAGARTTASVKETLIDNMITDGVYLCWEKINKTYPAEGENKPAHKGLVYSFGQRDLTKRLFPPAGNDLHKKFAVFGTDCSGLIINLFRRNGFNMPSTSSYEFANVLTTALKSDDKFKTIRVYSEEKMPERNTRSGDIIIWPGHMGMIYQTKEGVRTIIQSNGYPNPPDLAKRSRNLDDKRGVHPISLKDAIHGKGFWGTGYKILRLVEAGDSIHGGLIFNLDAEGKHGYVCTTIDQAVDAKWMPGFVSGTSTDMGKGLSNTRLLVAAIGSATHPANLCDNLVLNGYNDWFLPSRDELRLIFSTLAPSNLSSFKTSEYCSSSDYETDAMWCTSLTLAITYKGLKYGVASRYNTYGVRAVRQF